MQSVDPHNTRSRTKFAVRPLDNANPQGASVSAKVATDKTKINPRFTTVNQDSYSKRIQNQRSDKQKLVGRFGNFQREPLRSIFDQFTPQTSRYAPYSPMNTKKPTGFIKPYTAGDFTQGQESLTHRGTLYTPYNADLSRVSVPDKEPRSYTKTKPRNTFVLQGSKRYQKQRSGQSDLLCGIGMQSEHSIDDRYAKVLLPSESEISSRDQDVYCVVKPRTKRDVLADTFYSLKEQDVTEGQNSLVKELLGHRMMSDTLDGVDHLGASVQDKDARSITKIKPSPRESTEDVNRSRLRVDLAEECLKYSSNVPPIVVTCLQEVEKRGLYCEGIYRNSAGQDLVYNLCQHIEENQESINFEAEDPHVICNVLKEYLRRLREPLLTFGHYQDLIAVGMALAPGSTYKGRVVEDLTKIIHKLPLINMRTCRLIMHHLKRVTAYSDENKMTANNLGEVFHHVLLRYSNESTSLRAQDSKTTAYAARVVALLITHADTIFGPAEDSGAFLKLSENEIPEELFYNPHDVELFLKAVEEGTEIDKCVRVMVVGHYAQGKTSLTRRLSGQSIEGVESTDGIEVHRKICSKNRQQWESRSATEQEDEMINRLIKVSMSHQTGTDTTCNESTALKSDTHEEVTAGTDTTCNESTALKSDTHEEVTAHIADTKQQGETVMENEQITNNPITTTLYERTNGKSTGGKYDKLLYSRFAKKLQLSKQMHEPATNIREENVIDINVWDFGGQFVYYATHQIFHSRNAIYLLVFNLNENLDDLLVDEDFSNIKFTMRSALEFWMDSILSFVGSAEGKKPTVILVGTHKNDCQGKERKRIESVLDIFSKTKAMNHILPTQFAVECMDRNDTDVENLRKVIYELSEKSSKQNIIPAKWIPLEKKLFEIKEKGNKIVPYTEILQIDAESSHPIRDEGQVKLFLKYHHEKGNFVFFDEEGLCEFVVLDSQFLIDAFKSIITSKRFYKWRASLQQLGERLTESATLEMILLDKIWKNDETNKFYIHKNILLALMQRLRILTEMADIQATSKKSSNERCFLVPSLLKGNVEEDVVMDFLQPCKMRTKVSLILTFENSSILQLLYQRVMAAVLAKWPPVCIPKKGPLLFRNLGIYVLNFQHAGLVRLSRSGLDVTTVNLCPNNPVDARVCDKFRRYIEMVIMSEFEKFSKGLENEIFKYFIRCNHPDHGYKGSVYLHELKSVEAEDEVFCPDHASHSINVPESLVEWFQSDVILPNENLSENEISDKELSKVAQAIGENWTLLGLDLGLSQVDIDCLKEDHLRTGVRTTIYYMLKEWKKRNPHQDNLKTLIIIMKQCKSLRVNWDKIKNIIDNF